MRPCFLAKIGRLFPQGSTSYLFNRARVCQRPVRARERTASLPAVRNCGLRAPATVPSSPGTTRKNCRRSLLRRSERALMIVPVRGADVADALKPFQSLGPDAPAVQVNLLARGGHIDQDRLLVNARDGGIVEIIETADVQRKLVEPGRRGGTDSSDIRTPFDFACSPPGARAACLRRYRTRRCPAWA